MAFSYSQLNLEASEIRLVRFKEPASANPDTSPIELDLRSVSLDENPHYAALSYTWGRPDPSTAAQTHVNGGPFVIGHELHVALRQLRQNGVQSWLWVDSICINQTDPEEKSWQVAQMRAIFSQAERVYMWLGPGSIKTHKAMEFIARVGPRALAAGVLDLRTNSQLREQVCQYLKRRVLVSELPNESSLAVKELADLLFDIIHTPEFKMEARRENGRRREGTLAKSIRNILRLNYWHRIWIIQEVALANEATVICGEGVVDLKHLDAALTAIKQCQDFKLYEDLDKEFGVVLPFIFYRNLALDTRYQHRLRDGFKVIRLASIVVPTSGAPGRPHYSATDARDIVFGLLGVVTDGEALGLRVDYNMTLAEVFTALTRALILDGDQRFPHDYHLDRCVPTPGANQPPAVMPAWVSNWRSNQSPALLPSWVPDWRIIGEKGLRVYPINNRACFNATAGAPTPPRPSNVSEGNICGVLRRPGCCIDIITEVMKPPRWQSFDQWSASRIVDADGWLASIRDFTKLGPESGPGEDYIWRTVMRDHYDGVNRPNKFEAKPIDSEQATLIRKLMRRTFIKVETLTEAQREYISHITHNADYVQSISQTQLDAMRASWLESIGSCDRGRTLFKTTKGMFGLGHVAIRPGDVVTLLWGVRSPIVLRPRSDRDGGGFTFVGDAYVDGIMDGEFLATMPTHVDFEIY